MNRSPLSTPPEREEPSSPGRSSPAPGTSIGGNRPGTHATALAPGLIPAGRTSLVLPPRVRASLDAWVRAGHPEEACGLLVGRVEGELILVERAVQARNLARRRRRDRFDLDPVAFVSTDRAARAEGLEVVGVWHSHPDRPAIPSEDDRRMAWANHSYLIAAVDEYGVRELASFRLDGGRFVREALL